GTIDCGTCTLPDTCGSLMPGQCGHRDTTDAAVCVPKSCPTVNGCGDMSDGCGNLLHCGGTCPANTTCGGGGTLNVCGAPSCTKTSCAMLGAACGTQGDNCGGTLDCGTCTVAGETCGGGGMNNTCGKPACTGLCQQQVTCSGSATTSISGTVFAPNGTDP